MPGGNHESRIVIGISPALLLLAAIGAARAEPEQDRVEFAQLIIRERVIIRVPAQPAPAVPPRIKLKEKKGPRCLPMSGVAGAAVIEQDSVDLILKGGSRVRARFESSCPALDYYSGFYILPTRDGQICADRDSIHTRAGGECQITRFRALVPDR
jgi:hypothetical protein